MKAENKLVIDGIEIRLSQETVHEIKKQFGLEWEPSHVDLLDIEETLDMFRRVGYSEESIHRLAVVLLAQMWVKNCDKNPRQKVQKTRIKLLKIEKTNYGSPRPTYNFECAISREQSRTTLFDAFFTSGDKVKMFVKWFNGFQNSIELDITKWS